jgi:SAM-dependent methyltransferase
MMDTNRVKKTIKDALLHIRYLPQEAVFHADSYLRLNARRLEHLASLQIPVAGKSILELGAGIGDLSHYFLDRDCRITITEVRKSNISYIRRRYPHTIVRVLDLENPIPLGDTLYDVVHCYGLLYHLSDPSSAIDFMGSVCAEFLILETCVSFGNEMSINPIREIKINPSQSYSGYGCRPTRSWMAHELAKHFNYVYIPKTQPNHAQFPIDWTKVQTNTRLTRAVFIASKIPLKNELLSDHLLQRQSRHM